MGAHSKAEKILPKYPVYIPSKGRAHPGLTARFLVRDGCPFRLVVEPQEADEYIEAWGEERVLVLPFSNLGEGSIPARNWIKDHSISEGHERHWQIDDNIRWISRRWKGKRIQCDAGVALRVLEDFADRYENVAIAGMNYEMFVAELGQGKIPPFYRNVRVYSCSLMLNEIPHRWRGRYNEDTDLCLQVLADGWCTILTNAFLVAKEPSMQHRGGNTDELYEGDGRLKMARSLERMWPGIVTTKRRFNRPQHVIKDQWRKFDTPLKLRPEVDLSKIEEPDEYGMNLSGVENVEHPRLKEIAESYPQPKGKQRQKQRQGRTG